MFDLNELDDGLGCCDICNEDTINGDKLCRRCKEQEAIDNDIHFSPDGSNPFKH
ncbi:hypothetical protein I6F48_00255 [Pseudoalteromonas sp. SWYJ118]|uniref:hypothetical protein n=1 Tax=Pseudoalteromonas sp. SWYJ118 TaxID=2792062 RepID=UPI0018CCEF39|nr:hypothetical protein [Pseudoalteromonas sp. SWYJ118]MBH0073995.1 hypothetical protein [Pseudoalteromonas sp. SWYJ118]